MKTQTAWLMFMLIANMVSSFIMNAQTADGDFVFPGVEYHRELNATGDITEYETELNATSIMKNMTGIVAEGWEYVISQFLAVFTFIAKIRWLFDGFPQMLDWFASFIPTYISIGIFVQFGNILRALNIFMLFTLALEFLWGYQILP